MLFVYGVEFISWLSSREDIISAISFFPEFYEVLSKILYHCNVTFFEIILRKYAYKVIYYLYERLTTLM